MSNYKKISRTFVFIGCLLATLTLNSFQSQQNRLYGEIQFSEEIDLQEIYVPLNSLKIEALTVRQETQPDGQQIRTSGEIVQSTHPDSRGYFTFIDIEEGIYFIRVSMLDVVLMNDLYQAEIRVQYINQRYKLPIIEVKLEQSGSAHELGLKAANTSEYLEDNNWEWRIYIVAPREVINSIDCVEYNLHKTFRKRFWKICRDENFDPTYPFSPPVFRGWGVFSVPIKVFFKDGKICYLNHMLVFDY